jgi:hypothetical protein
MAEGVRRTAACTDAGKGGKKRMAAVAMKQAMSEKEFFEREVPKKFAKNV